MYKFIAKNVYAFDAEWVPDPESGRRVYNLPETLSDAEVIERMWIEGGATPEDPKPYLKTVLCRIVSVATVIRKKHRSGKISLKLYSLPGINQGAMEEAEIISRFLKGVGENKPQLVGFNSINSDIAILIQRALKNKVSVPEFCQRPNKPWEGADYFARFSDHGVDLKETIGGYGKASFSLHELATVLGIPGKVGTSGGDVPELWANGEIDQIVQYNQYDALTTYLVWLRTALFSGQLTREEYLEEEEGLKGYLKGLIEKGDVYLQIFLDKWEQLS